MKEFGAEKDDTIVFEQIGTYEFQLHLEKSDGRRISAPIAAARSIAKTEAEKRSQANERDLEKRNEVSRGVQPEFGVRQSRYEDGVHTLYAAVFTGDGVRLLGREKDFDGDLILVKIGMSNDTRRRCMELNAGFPPAATGKWVMKWQSDFADGRSAFKAETALKKELDLVATSLGGEFFLGDQAILSKTFSRIAAH